MEGIEKMMRNVIFDHHEQVVGPMLVKMSNNISKLEKDVSGLKKDNREIKSQMSQMDGKLDKVAEIVTDVKANHERRIRVAEDELGVKTAVRLNF